MKRLLLLLLLLLISAALLVGALTIDESLPNGVYYAQPDPDHPGRTLHKRFDAGSGSGSGSRSRSVFRRSRDSGRYHVAVDKGHPPKGDPRKAYFYEKGTLREDVPAHGINYCYEQPPPGISHPNKTIDTEDYYDAINALFDTTQFWVPSHFARYALHGSAVVYICNFGDDFASAGLLEFVYSMDVADRMCGFGTPANRHIDGTSKSYGREARGYGICLHDRHGKEGPSTDLLWWQGKGCETHVNGIERFLGYKGICYDNIVGSVVKENIQKLLYWFQRSRREREKYIEAKVHRKQNGM